MFGKRTKTTDARAEIGGVEEEQLGRRHLLRFGGIAAAGAAAAAAVTVAGAQPAGAGVDGDLTLNSFSNSATAPTQLNVDHGGSFVPDFFGLGVADQSAPGGWADQTPAIIGRASGVNFLTGVQGQGVNGNAGVVGESDTGNGVTGTGLFGVVGNASSDGIGVQGNALDGGVGVIGSAASVGAVSVAVRAEASRATDIALVAAHDASALALAVHGKATFTRSGVLTIPAGAQSAMTGAVAGGLNSLTSHVLATKQTHTATVITVESAVPIFSGANINKITIYLSAKAPTGGVKVAWFVVG